MSLSPEEIRSDILKVLKLSSDRELDTYEIYEKLTILSDFYEEDYKKKINGNISQLWKTGQIEKVGSRNNAGIWRIKQQ